MGGDQAEHSQFSPLWLGLVKREKLRLGVRVGAKPGVRSLLGKLGRLPRCGVEWGLNEFCRMHWSYLIKVVHFCYPNSKVDREKMGQP